MDNELFVDCNLLIIFFEMEFINVHITTKLFTGPTALKDYYVLNVLIKGVAEDSKDVKHSKSIMHPDKNQIELAMKYLKKKL